VDAVMRRLPRWSALLLAFLLWSAPQRLDAQVRPDLEWATLANDRIRVHFTPELETLARRTLANAAWAYDQLAKDLPAPRGIVDIIIADNVDYANGYATPYPSNRIVVYARPPVDEPMLRNHADWNRILVTHEMVHIFHLDRVRGIWALGQRVFGRAAPLFPNRYAPTWLIEGIAVHYETRLTGGGRLGGMEYPAMVRALAQAEALPALDAITSPRPFFPGATTPYLLGAYLVDRAVRNNDARTPGESMARLIDETSGRINPWRLDASAEAAVGTSFTALYAAWRDSVTRASDCRTGSTCIVNEAKSVGAWNAASPRFSADGTLRVVLDDVRRMPGLYELEPDGELRRVGRRNSVDANAPLDETRTVYAEWDRTDPYSVRSDLYLGTGRARRRLSVDERLASPDVHGESGRIVAVRTEPGTTDLVMRSDVDGMSRAIVRGTLDRNWSDPRWSRSGRLIAASRWERGGRTSVVVLDTLGRELQRFSPRATNRLERAPLVATPVWLPGDSLVLFTSDHDGVPRVYRGDVRSGAYAMLWSTNSALRAPDVSPDGTRLVALELRADGWALVTRAMPELGAVAAFEPAAEYASSPVEPVASIDTLEFASRYRARTTLRATWWLPAMDQSDEGFTRLGLLTGGNDVLGRHAWQANVRQDLERPELSAAFGYSWAGLGNPVLSAGFTQEWVHGAIVDTAGARVGTLGRRSTTFSGSVYAVRPRVRFTTYALLVPEVEIRTFSSYPGPLVGQLNDPELLDVDLLPSVAVAMGLSSMQRPGLSVSVEDGVAAQATWRTRFNGGVGGRSAHEAIVEASAAKSLPLRGFARHVIAVRGAQGAASSGSNNLFEIGGVSGSSLEVLPGFSLGGTRRTFFVRGFAPGTAVGNRAAVGSVEYRAPLARVGRGVGLIPASLRALSAVGFVDAGSAWCSETGVTASPFCRASRPGEQWVASMGGELIFDTALQYDVLYRMRLGFAAPVQGAERALRSATVYFTFGSTF
jgi:hypothetical protein